MKNQLVATLLGGSALTLYVCVAEAAEPKALALIEFETQIDAGGRPPPPPPPPGAVPMSGKTEIDRSSVMGVGWTGRSALERDARGIPVVSDPAAAPLGWNSSAVTTVPAGTAAGGASVSFGHNAYPACTRGRTDSCVQLYERGPRRR